MSLLEVTIKDPPHTIPLADPKRIVRRPCTVPGEKYSCMSGAHHYKERPCPREILRDVDVETLSPVCTIRTVSRYNAEDESCARFDPGSVSGSKVVT